MPQQAYVWQRAWTPPVTDAVEHTAGRFAGLVVLAGEVSFNKTGQLHYTRTQVGYSRVAKTCPRASLLLRIGECPGGAGTAHPATPLLIEVAGSLVGHARAGGLDVAELFVEFDCEPEELSGCRDWLEGIRRRVAPLPVAVKVQPQWLGRKDAAALIASADAFVLRGHCGCCSALIAPEPRDIDWRELPEYVETAARLGRPFRVSLSAHSHESPDRMAALVERWTRDRPANLVGVIWHRLPVGGDETCWRMETLNAVMAGRAPRPDVQAAARVQRTRFFDIELVNRGDADGPAGRGVSVTWESGELKSATAAAGVRADRTADRSVQLLRVESPPDAGVLRPGDAQTLGTLEFAEETTVKVELVK